MKLIVTLRLDKEYFEWLNKKNNAAYLFCLEM